MRTVRRLFYTEVVWSVTFVAAAFLSLMYFIDAVDQLGDVGKDGQTAMRALAYGLFLVPGHLYELAPIAVLIGTIYALARLAQSSEYTILRTAGLGPGRALSLLGGLGLAFGLVTFVVGDYAAPWSEEAANALHAAPGSDFAGTGVWLKDRQPGPAGEQSVAVRIGRADASGRLGDVRIYTFGEAGELVERVSAASARVDRHARWTLSDVTITRWPAVAATRVGAGAIGLDAATAVVETQASERVWQSGLTPQVVAAAVLPSSTMSTFELRRYIDHLALNEQAAQEYEIQFWKRALYPFACLVMMALALPFAYLRARAGGVNLKVFGGIVLGISFVLLNNVAGHLGLLHGWTPWIVASVPSIVYLLLSLGAFAWLVRFR